MKKSRSPPFLAKCDAYDMYKRAVPVGELRLPPYDTDAETGNVIVVRGEVYCRMPNCPRAKIAFCSTTNLRNHLRGQHDVVLQHVFDGRATRLDRENSISWYNSLFEDAEENANGEIKHEEDNELKFQVDGHNEVKV
ncbi:uncharacterized protein N7496_000091 [Penicillium cataractarum]|uniref:Uncharacterized protein n=1 Tax=Penicillium cataractarum TaxID=2100454 RepID=A0A9W9VTG3_9EURO|nr:uncharacterized protein N7496_000091 [Penicillium cataractarum]KAJ5389023.1 hypothetical protein N7496_000091 [Penicillium cataractarum]